MAAAITASMLYDVVLCPHRVTLDLYGDPDARDPVGAFVRMLWEGGAAFEKETIANLSIPFVDLSPFHGDEKEAMTLAAFARGDALIHSGRIRHGDLLGEPDLLRREGDGYVPGDIKSGAGAEGTSGESEGERKPKPHYAVQLALYVDVLERLELSAGRRAFVWDVDGEEVAYRFDSARGPKTPETLWQLYERTLATARAIVARAEKTRPAHVAKCKQCAWRSPCLAHLELEDDLTLIPELGRAKRDAMSAVVPTMTAFANADLATLVRGKQTVFAGIGPERLARFQRRARLQKGLEPGPVAIAPFALPSEARELFFDVEVDPMREVCYLHGFLERAGGVERYVPFVAAEPTLEAEGKAFREAWRYASAARPCAVYHYSSYERTQWRRLQKLHPGVCSADELEAFFASPATVDLHAVVSRCTDWPTRDLSLKTLAVHLGFHWRDSDPSGASSIEWYHRWVAGDLLSRGRILLYNEDDCRATRVLLDRLRRMSSPA